MTADLGVQRQETGRVGIEGLPATCGSYEALPAALWKQDIGINIQRAPPCRFEHGPGRRGYKLQKREGPGPCDT